MLRRSRVLAETLIILASATVVLLLLMSNPAKAADGGDPPPIITPPTTPSQSDSSPQTPPSDNSQPPSQSEPSKKDGAVDKHKDPSPQDDDDDSHISDPGNNGQASDQETSIEDPSDEDILKDSSKKTEESEQMSESEHEPLLDSLDERADQEQTTLGTSEQLIDGELERQNDGSEIDENDENLGEENDELAIYGPINTLTSEEQGTGMEEDTLKEKELTPIHSVKQKTDKSVTSSAGAKVVKIKLSSNIDKIVQEPITKFLVGMYTRLDSTSDLSGIRKKLYEYIKAHPGEHMAILIKEFNLSPSCLSHHINVLEKNGFILAHSDGRYKRLFANHNGYISTVDSNYKPIISVLKKENAKRIIFFLMAKPLSTQHELSEALSLHPSTIHWHTDRLQDLGLVQSLKEGKNIKYSIDDSSLLIKVLSLV